MTILEYILGVLMNNYHCNIMILHCLNSHLDRSVSLLEPARAPEAENCGLRMRQECRERFLRHWLQRKPIFSDPCMHHGTCVTHVPWSISGSLIRGGGENVPGIPGACATRNFTHLASCPLGRFQEISLEHLEITLRLRSRSSYFIQKWCLANWFIL